MKQGIGNHDIDLVIKVYLFVSTRSNKINKMAWVCHIRLLLIGKFQPNKFINQFSPQTVPSWPYHRVLHTPTSVLHLPSVRLAHVAVSGSLYVPRAGTGGHRVLRLHR